MIAEQIDFLVNELKMKGVPDIELDEVHDLAFDNPTLLRRLLERKRFGEPNAYLRGTVTRFGRAFKIDRRTYIPDPYPETLLKILIAELPQGASVLDVGTGCGWIGITLACERPDLTVMAADIDPAALELARANAIRHGVDMQLFESHFVSDVAGVQPDFVIAVLPYGGDADDYSWRELEERPQMPPIALFDPISPLHAQREFVRSVRQQNWRCRSYIETGYLAENRVRSAMQDVVADFDYHRVADYAYMVIDF